MVDSNVEHTSFLTGPRAFTPNELKPLAPQSIKDKIMRLSTFGFYGIPIRIALKLNGKKSTVFPPKYDNIVTPQRWTENIQAILDNFDNPNGIAILTGPSALYVIDVDVADDEKKRSGLSLWKTLIAQNTEPDTLKAISGSGGFHFYFRMDQTNGLQRLNNFEGLTIDGVTYAIDGRGIGGVIFAPPTCYKGIDGTSMLYSWATEGTTSPKEMPKWLVECVNMGRANSKAGSTSRRSKTCLASGSGNDEERAPATIYVCDEKKPTLAQLEIQELLQKKANDRESVYSGSTVLADGNRSFQFRVKAPRTCYLGKQHNGSNNFTVIQGCAGDFREVFYRCFGTACANDENTRILGKLSIPAALEQVGVDGFGIKDRSVSCTSNLSARLNPSFMGAMVCRSDWGSASIFAKLFEHDVRVIFDQGVFWTWNSTTWLPCDSEATIVKSAFMYHMGRVKAFWKNHIRTTCNDELEKVIEAKDARLEQLARASNESPSKEDIEKMKKDERAILRDFENSEKRSEQSARWQGPDIESVPIASRCLIPLKQMLKVDGFGKELNANRDYLNTASGAIHLPTGNLVPHHPCNMLSRESTTEYEAATYPSPLIDEFMLQVQTPDMIPLLQMTLGYGITGHSKEKQFLIFYGPSNSGKTKLVTMIREAMGPYCVSMDRDCVIGVGAHSEGAATPHLLKLEGSHVAVLEETKEDDVYNCAYLKSITSGDGSMTVRGLHMKPLEVTMRCLPIICTNSLPKFNVGDTGTLKKLRVFPFNRDFVENPQPNTNERLIDPDLMEKIKTPEWRKQLLAWLVRGSMAWYARGSLSLVEELPKGMQDALDGYIKDNDHFRNFVADHCILRERNACHVETLKKAYENYIGRRDRPMIVTEFKVLMRGLKDVTYAKQVKIGGRNTTGYRGICLRKT